MGRSYKKSLPWGRYGYFLELCNFQKSMTWSNMCPEGTRTSWMTHSTNLYSHVYWRHLHLSDIWYIWSALNQPSINISINISINNPSTLDWHSIDSWLIVGRVSTNSLCIDQHSIACPQKLANSQLTVNQVLTVYWWRCQSSFDRDVDQVSIEGLYSF